MPSFKAGLSNPPFDAMERAGKTFQVSMLSAKLAHTQDLGLRLVVHRSLFPPTCTRGGRPLKSGDSGPSYHFTSPMSLPACSLGQVLVVEDNFSSFLGLAGSNHFWGGAATVEGNSPSDTSLDHCVSLLRAERSWGSVEMVGRLRSGCEMAGPVGTCLGGTGSALSHVPVIQDLLSGRHCASTGDTTVNKADRTPCPCNWGWWGHVTGEAQFSNPATLPTIGRFFSYFTVCAFSFLRGFLLTPPTF